MICHCHGAFAYYFTVRRFGLLANVLHTTVGTIGYHRSIAFNTIYCIVHEVLWKEHSTYFSFPSLSQDRRRLLTADSAANFSVRSLG